MKLIVDSKFELQQTILIFGANFQKKVHFRLKTQKNEHPIEFFILELV